MRVKLQTDYSIKYISNPFYHLKGLGFSYGDWEVLETTPRRLTGGIKTVRYTKLEIEMPDWLDELAQKHPAPDTTPVAKSVALPAKASSKTQAVQARGASKTSASFLNRLGKLLGLN